MNENFVRMVACIRDFRSVCSCLGTGLKTQNVCGSHHAMTQAITQLKFLGVSRNLFCSRFNASYDFRTCLHEQSSLRSPTSHTPALATENTGENNNIQIGRPFNW